jgi:hypothetical protein
MRIAPTAGIAIGPILFILAILGAIASMISMSSGGMGMATGIDRTKMELSSQIQLVQTKIDECALLNRRSYNEYRRDHAYDKDAPDFDPAAETLYPPADAPEGILVRNYICPATRDHAETPLWAGGVRQAFLPPPPTGFGDWRFVNNGESGRCFFIQPESSKAAGSKTIREGIAAALKKMPKTAYSYDPASPTQRIVIWVTRPTGQRPNCGG